MQVLPGGARLKDNNSTNGSFYRDTRFTTLEAGPGTEIRPDKTVLRVEPFGETSKPGPAELPFKDAKDRLIQQFEPDYLQRLMQRCDDNLSKAAREAGVERLHLRKLLRKHGLRGDDER